MGGSLQDGDQFYVTEDSIQVVDLLIVSIGSLSLWVEDSDCGMAVE